MRRSIPHAAVLDHFLSPTPVIAVARGDVAPHEFGAYLEAMQPVGGYRRLFVVSGMSTVFDTAL